ncbi:hypothetical protein VTJ49DRAFT_816 [Mycothermus thermophilus]|uniref:SANT domain-containing protein n=1 Tax=Humicola insolens TaxID=85995 RepID=A0ABR3VE86_HUMIN
MSVPSYSSRLEPIDFWGRGSRYTGNRFDPDRRSRSPHDRSPYGDRGPQYNDPDRRRPPPDTRGNPSNFPSGRDGFRDSLSGIQPPRGPKALIDAHPPSGPRGGGFVGDFHGRGRGGSRGRHREDYRDRFRDERSRERDRPHDRDRDRDWPRDQRDRIDFRGRRPSPPPLRPRSPPGRDFRDPRDSPLGIDPERAGRGSRDGPLSAGSSNSDPIFTPSSYRGGFGRGAGRGGPGGGGGPAGGPGAGRGRRSQESRWGREPDDRDRRDSRYPDTVRDLREDRDVREREARDREPARPKPERVSHEPQPPAKDVSPPPLAPSAPAFGSVPSRQPASTEIQSLTGKPPPTGPRALTEERPVTASSAVVIERLPPTGPSNKAALPDGPLIPVGPRAQQKQQRSSMQWVNPSRTAKKPPESPKTPRPQAFPPQPIRPPGSFSAHPDHHRDFDKRPRSPGARSDSHVLSADRFGSHVATGPNEIAIKSERGSLSARTSVDREIRTAPNSAEVPISGTDDRASKDLDEHHEEPPTVAKSDEVAPEKKDAVEEPAVEPRVVEQPAPPVETRPTFLAVPSCRIQLPPREPSGPVSDESSESDEEDMDLYFEHQISKNEAELKRLQDAREKVPIRIVRRYAVALHRAITSVLDEAPSLAQLAGPIPPDLTFPRPPPVRAPDVEMTDAEAPHDTEKALPDAEMTDAPAPVPTVEPEVTQPVPTEEPSAVPMSTVEETDDSSTRPPEPEPEPQQEPAQEPAQEPEPEPQPKIEEMDVEGSGLPEVPPVQDAKPEEELPTLPAADTKEAVPPLPRSPSIPRPPTAEAPAEAPADVPQPLEQEVEKSSASSGVESEDRTEDDASIYGSAEAVREYSTTPPTEDLPVYNVKPWYKSRRVRQLAKEAPEFGEFLLNHMRDQAVAVHQAQQELRAQYAKDYEAYLDFTKSDDPAAVKSREYFNAGISGTSGKSATAESKPERGRRAAGFATELDLEAAIKESIREHQERKEREERAQKEKYRTEKEAVIPEMYWTQEEKDRASFYDTSGLLPLEKLIATYQVVPRHINFTPEEAEKFEKAYLEAPKQWGKIAKELGNRDPGTCILYYYAMKRELNLKEKLKRQPRRRKKGRGKQRSSALVSELGNTENETEGADGQDAGENGERRRPPRRAAAPVWGNNKDSNNNSNNEATPAAESDGTTPAPATSRRRGGAAAGNDKNDAGSEKTEGKRGGRKRGQTKADKEKEAAAKAPKQLAQAPGTPALGVPAKTGRSRANSKAQQPQEWTSAPQTPVDLAAHRPLPFEVPHGAMQPPPLVPVHQAAIASPDRPAPSAPPSAISEVMAPPSLRPEPPQPPTSGPAFEIPQPSAGPERNRTPQQASSYWSVPETTDFPGLLRAFGTDWAKIANHMKTKTMIMVKNFYMKKTKEGGNPEWEQIAAEADAKAQRGEKRPAPPTPTQGSRKRYDMSSTSTSGHRALAAAEPEDGLLTKVEPQSQSGFSRFQVPIAQAAPVSHPLAQPSQPMTAPLVPAPTAQQAASGSMAAQVMSPRTRPLRPPGPSYSQYQEREPEPPVQPPPPPPQQQQQSLRISQKPPVPTSAPAQPIPEPAPHPSSWATDLSHKFSLLPKGNETRPVRPGPDLTRRESPRPVERAPPPLRMKQEPEPPAPHRVEAYPPQYPPPQQQRVLNARPEPAPLGRQPEPPRSAVPASQSYASPVHSQPLRGLLSEPVPVQPSHMAPREDRPMATAQRPPVMQDPYAPVPVSAPSAPPPSQAPSQPPPAPRAPERKVNIMSLLNDDEPPAPKRVAEVPSVTGRSTPQPQPMSRAPPQPSTMATRREVDPGYPYGRSPAPPTTSAIPPLKPYQTQSPQPHHVRAPSSGIQTAADSVEREYYSRHYGSQHAVSATNSPQTQHAHYPPHGSHMQQQQQQQQQAQQQPSQMGYQGQQQAYQSYQQPQHGQMPQYPPQSSSLSGRREAPPTREPWGQQQQHQQQQQQPPQQQGPPQQQPVLQPPHHHHHPEPPHHRREPSHHRASSQSGWGPTPAKPSPAVPKQSAWGAQHGSVQVPPVSSSPLPPQSQQHHTWSSSGPTQPQPNPLSLREPGPPSGYDAPPHQPRHRHHHSTSISSRYGGMPHHGEQQPPQPMQQQQPPNQPPPQYPPYGNPGGPMPQGRENPRSYTPVSAGGYDPRGPPPQQQQQQQQQGPPSQGQAPQQGPPHPHQHQHHHSHSHSLHHHPHAQHQHQHPHQQQHAQHHQGYMSHEAMPPQQMRDMRGPPELRDPRDPSGGNGAGILGRQLRPGPEAGPGGPYGSPRMGPGGSAGPGGGERGRY